MLDRKRQEFPRLLFIERKQFKWLLLNPDKLCCSNFMSVLFSGIKEITLVGGKMKGVVSHAGEAIVFKKNAERRVIWLDLKWVEEELSRIVTWEINLSANKNQRYWVGKAARLLCEWTSFMEEAISKR